MKKFLYLVFALAVLFMAVSMLVPKDVGTTGVTMPFGVTLGAFDAVVLLAFLGLGLWLVGHVDTPLSQLELAVIVLVLCYLTYEVFVVVPLGVMSGLSPIFMLRSVAPRLAVVLLPTFYLLLRNGVRSATFVGALSLVAAIVAVIVVVRYLVLGPLGGVDEIGFRLREAWGGTILLFGWLLLGALIIRRNGLLSLCLSLLAVLAIALTNQRSGYVALLVALLFYVAFNRRKSGRAIVIASLAATGVILVVAFMPVVKDSMVYSVQTMFSVNADLNTQDRVVTSVAAWNEFTRRPLGDIAWHPTDNYASGHWDAHNVVFQVLAAEGLIGFLFHAALWGVIFAAAFRHRHFSAVLRFGSTYIVFYLVFCLFNTNFYSSANAILLMSVGAVILAGVADFEGERQRSSARLSLLDAYRAPV